MYRTIVDFCQAWAVERDSTYRLFCQLTDAALAQRVDAEGWTLGQIAWHITTAIGELMGLAGLPLGIDLDEHAVPEQAATIAETYARVAAALQAQVPARWTDATLHEEIDVFGQRWTRGVTLAVVCAHQTHHRGQMTVLMRQAGLRPIGVCGPSREEWAAILAAQQE